MLQITYINGDIQNINVDGTFYSVSLALKNGKQNKLLPIDKGESFARDLAERRGTPLHKVILLDPETKDILHKRMIEPLSIREYDYVEPTPGYLKEKKLLRKKFKNQKFTQKFTFNF